MLLLQKPRNFVGLEAHISCSKSEALRQVEVTHLDAESEEEEDKEEKNWGFKDLNKIWEVTGGRDSGGPLAGNLKCHFILVNFYTSFQVKFIVEVFFSVKETHQSATRWQKYT